MSGFCLDTSAYSYFKRGHREVVQMMDRAGWIGVPTVVLGELHAGFEGGSRTEQNEAELREFLAQPVVKVLPVDHEVAKRFGMMVDDLRRRGTPKPTNDIWVAATASVAGATLLALDAHFDDFPRVDALVLDPRVY